MSASILEFQRARVKPIAKCPKSHIAELQAHAIDDAVGSLLDRSEQLTIGWFNFFSGQAAFLERCAKDGEETERELEILTEAKNLVGAAMYEFCRTVGAAVADQIQSRYPSIDGLVVAEMLRTTDPSES